MSGPNRVVSKVHATDQKFYGVYEGIVTSVKDDSREGHVSVKLPWYDNRTEFVCRVRQSYAGKKFGSFFIPEPKTEVLIAFIQGDMRFPIVLGGLYNGVDKPPTYRTDDKNEKMIQTQAGHKIILDDTKGYEKIRIIEKDGNNEIVIDTVGNSITIKSKNGTINIEGKEINLKSQGDTNIEAKGSVNIKGSGDVNVKGSTINLN